MLKRVCVVLFRGSKGGFPQVVAFEVNLECVFAEHGGFLSWRKDALGFMTVAFESLNSYYVED